jgi:small-conductance mechanosensitive channel
MTGGCPARIALPPWHAVSVSAVLSDVGDYIRTHTDVVIQRPARILIIIVVALVLRLLLHRAIDRITVRPQSGALPAILRPLRGNAATNAILEAAAMNGERHQLRAATLGSVLKSAVSFTVFVFATIYIINELDFSLAPLLAGTSIAGVAIGFGAQNIIKDFLGGIFMILEDQYGVGDVVDLKEASGTVEAVGLRSTRLRDERGTVWYVRNGEIVRVGNQSQGFAQVVLDVPIAAGGNVGQAEAVMRAVAAQIAAEPEWSPRFLADPVVQGIQSITLEATTIRLVARVRPLEQWTVARELRGRIVTQLDAVGVHSEPDVQSVPEPAPGSPAPESGAPAGTGS